MAELACGNLGAGRGDSDGRGGRVGRAGGGGARRAAPGGAGRGAAGAADGVTGGTGLGLSIVKHAVQYHHGDIRLTSKPGEGTVIRIAFPAEYAGEVKSIERLEREV